MSIDLSADIIDVRDIIEDYALARESDDLADRDYADALAVILGELAGNGGDEQFEGDWYPVTLIRDSYFKEYAQELADELELVPSEYSWPTSCIDWDHAARELRMDYTSVEINGVTYWYR